MTLLFSRFFCLCFFCIRGNRSVGGCLICSRIFVNKNDITKKIYSTFDITRNSIKDLDMFLLLKDLNIQCVVLNIWTFTTWLEIMLIKPKILMKYFVKLQMVILVYMFCFCKFILSMSLAVFFPGILRDINS